MKKIVLVFAVILSAFAASAQKMATVTTQSLAKGKSAGVYLFALPEDITAAQVDDAKKYYTNYFTVKFDPAKHEVSFTLLENQPMNRRVIQRFMSTLQIGKFKVDETEMTYDELYEKHMIDLIYEK